METQEEKLFRLEKKFLEARITELERSPDATQEKILQEQLPYVKKLGRIIDNFRRLKFFMEKEASLEAGKQLFSEYEDAILPKGMLPVFYEELESYLSQPFDEKFMSKRQVIDHSLILKMLTRKEWDEGTLPAHDFEQEHKRMLGSKDSQEFYDDLQKNLRSQALKIERSNLETIGIGTKGQKSMKVEENEDDEELESDLEDEESIKDSDDEKANEKDVSSLAGVKITSGKEGLDIANVNEDEFEEEEKDEAKFLSRFGDEKFIEEEIEKEEQDFKSTEGNIDEEREELMQFLNKAKMTKAADKKVQKGHEPKAQKKK